MSHIDRLVAAARRRAGRPDRPSDDELLARAAHAPPVRGFGDALAGGPIALVAEIKRATPRGPLAPDLDAAATAAAYARGGAAAISVLTEPDEFLGSAADLAAARGPGLPVLRKDFVLAPWQVLESRAMGADAVLVIVRILGPELSGLIEAIEEQGMDALVEVHDESDLERALDAGASLIGVNHRDLATFEVDPARTAKLAAMMPPGRTVVALSGVSTRGDVEALAGVGADAVLVGEALVTAPDPAGKIRELLGAP